MDTPVQIKIGLTCKLYRNSNTYEAPTWVEIDIVRDATLNVSKREWDASFRGGGRWAAFIATLKDASIDFEVLRQTQDTNWRALRNAWVDDTPTEFLMMDGDRTVAGNEGIRATFMLFDFNQAQPLAEGLVDKFTMKPTLAAHNPELFRAA